MADNETTQDEQTAQDGGSGARTAVRAAAAAAATGAAAMVVRKALSSSNGHSSNGKAKSGGGSSGRQGSGASLFSSVASGGWDAARDSLGPLAEDAAGAAGTYLGKNGPEIVREKIVPKFISSFNEARKEN
jgi:hypothetical protein